MSERCTLCGATDTRQVSQTLIDRKHASKRKVVRGDWYYLLHCRCCGVYFTKETLPDEQLHSIMNQGELPRSNDFTLDQVRDAYRYSALGHIRQILSTRMDLTSVKSMLEVGSGSGEFLDHFRAINQEAVIYSKEPSHRMAVLQKLFSVEPIMCYYLDEWSEYNKVRLDLVVSFETLEHLADPLRELRAIGESLNKDGRLFFSVPNGTYFHAKSRLLGIAPPSSHFYHFTPRSLRYICETANLKVRRIDAMKRIFEAKRSTRLKQAAMEIAYLAARAQLATTGSTPLSDSFLVECSRNTGA